MKTISEEYIAKGITYAAYRKLVNDLLEKGKTTGIQSPSLLEYTRLNEVRMNRLDRTLKLNRESQTAIQQLDGQYIWLVITEGWCGDAAQSLPVIAALSEQNAGIDLRIVLRDQHLELIDAFLTDGGRSIPKLLLLDAESRRVWSSWGPRPKVLQQYVQNTRKEILKLEDGEEQKMHFRQLGIDTQKWYAKDKTRAIQQELTDLQLEASLALMEV